MTTKLATYKGHKYRLLWTGPTKFGRRAKLGFMDGSKDFWVDAALVTEAAASTGSGQEMCAECGEYPGSVMCSDSSGFTAKCCRRCAVMKSYERSFA